MDLKEQFNEIQSMAFGYWLTDTGSSTDTCIFISSLCIAASYKPREGTFSYKHSTLRLIVSLKHRQYLWPTRRMAAEFLTLLRISCHMTL
jgi:hypothetical protein